MVAKGDAEEWARKNGGMVALSFGGQAGSAAKGLHHVAFLTGSRRLIEPAIRGSPARCILTIATAVRSAEADAVRVLIRHTSTDVHGYSSLIGRHDVGPHFVTLATRL